ncbi:serine hydrolase domain-containing protein [Pontimicrobium aquaticum]|uniref:Serine hydrolase n=1 Tax=Pontimicrobium aquaticum TaxID=2565367 RepID=A0A4U0EPA6_9FLAO|nr:serine hydrolase [Pontimicrobium aquaticum]TJY33456.1 serine hydrolase [Pontimicrobium aquaticum]
MKQLFIILLSISTFSFAQTPNFEKLDQFLDLLLKNNKLMGSLEISKNRQSIYQKSVGYQYLNYAKKGEATASSKYKIGSITKTFTATMIFQLIEEGKLSLNTKLSVHFPRVKNASKITIEHLLTHSSGLYNLTNAAEFGTWKSKPTTPIEMLSRIKKFDTMFQPGEKYEYSNTNYLLLGYIIERLDNKTYADALNTRIVNKLGLTNTYYGSDININNKECHSYTYANELWQQSPETHMSLPGGAGGIVSNTTDLIAFMEALFNNEIISRESLKAMTTPANEDFCKGIFKSNVQGQTLFGHEGGIDGFQSMLVYVPEFKTTIAFTANALNYSKMQIMLNAFQASLGMDIMLPTFNKIELTEDEVKQYTGVYESTETPYDLVFEANGTILKGAPEGSDLKDLVPTKKHEFAFEALQIKLNFNLSEQSVMFKQADKKAIKFTRKK